MDNKAAEAMLKPLEAGTFVVHGDGADKKLTMSVRTAPNADGGDDSNHGPVAHLTVECAPGGFIMQGSRK